MHYKKEKVTHLTRTQAHTFFTYHFASSLNHFLGVLCQSESGLLGVLSEVLRGAGIARDRVSTTNRLPFPPWMKAAGQYQKSHDSHVTAAQLHVVMEVFVKTKYMYLSLEQSIRIT